MKSNTKIRLHLSRQLFESLTKQVIAEGKNKHYGAGMEEVKAPKATKEKTPKMEVSNMPGVEKAPGLNLSKNDTPNKVFSKQDLKIKFQELIKQINQIKNFDQSESSAIANLIDDIIGKLQKGPVANQINMARKNFGNSTRNIKEMETKVAEDVTRGAKVDAQQIADFVGGGDPYWMSVIGVLAVVGGLITANELAPKLRGWYKGLTQKMDEGDGESQAAQIADLAKEVGIDLQ